MTEQAKKKKRKTMLTGGFILVFSLLALITGAYMGYKNFRVKRWPTAEGTIVEKSVVATDKATSARTAHYEARVRYRFTVDGTEHEATGIRPSIEITSKSEAQTLIDGLDEQVTVHYNPDKPSEAYLQTNSIAWPILAVILGLFGTLIGLGMVISGGKS